MALNDDILDESIRHQVDLQYYSNNVSNRMLKLLARADDDIISHLKEKLEQLPVESFTVRRLDALLGSVRSLNKGLYNGITDEMVDELDELVDYELGHQTGLFKKTLPNLVDVSLVNVNQVYVAAMARPFQGRLLREWMQGLEADKALRIRDAVRMGYLQGETISQIVRRIRGTRARNYKDGLLDITTRNAETVVRTAISHTAQYARNAFYEANDDLIKALKWSSTLDGKTSDPCRNRDGKLYTLDKKPIGHKLNWGGGAGAYHFNCRSVSVPVLKSWRELGIDTDELPKSTRASMDGQVPADTTYQDWLKKKPASFQDEVLGKTKGKLFRNGMKLERFENNKGRSYTIAELKERDSKYFS